MKNFLTLLLCLFIITLQAQIVDPDKVRFGKISDAEMELSDYPLDPDAMAVVIFDEGKLRMELDPNSNNFEYLLERHLRIKVLKAGGIQYANFSFLLENASNSTSKEEITDAKGATYNLVNGKQKETKLTKEGIFEEKIAMGLNRYTIVFPEVQIGSVIELKYTKKSDFLYNLPPWYFQQEIPTDYSSYEIVVPEYYEYNFEMKGHASSTLVDSEVGQMGTGYVYIKKTEKESVRVSMIDRKSTRASFGAPPADGDKTQKLDFNTYRSKWTAQAVPGLKQELYAPNIRNFFFRIEFELAGTNYPAQSGQSFTRNWDNIFDSYQREANAQPYLDPNNNIQEMVSSLDIKGESKQDKIIRIYKEIQAGFTWNNIFWIISQQRPLQLINTKSGNSADINYLLTGALRAADIDAYPVLISTKENGYLSMTRPSLTQFNHLIVAVEINEGEYCFLDAAQKDVPAFLLPPYDLVEKGRIIKENTTEWIEITPVASKKTAVQLAMSLTKSGELKGSANLKISDYSAMEFRQKMVEESALINHLANWFGAPINIIESTGFDNPYKELNIQATVDASELLTHQNEFYYIPIILGKHYAENPLKTEKRILPVDFVIPLEHIYIVHLSLEEGLSIDELPKDVSFAMPNGKAHFSVRFIEMNGGIQIIEKLSIKDPVYTAEEYTALKKFFDLVIEHQETILTVKSK